MIPAIVLVAAVLSSADLAFLRECDNLDAMLKADDALAELTHGEHMDQPADLEVSCEEVRERLARLTR